MAHQSSSLRYSDADALKEKCGVFGFYSQKSLTGRKGNAADYIYVGLWALQHRGQEASGISVSDGKRIKTYKNEGLVASVYTEKRIRSLTGHLGIGHNRYGTSGGAGRNLAQPLINTGDSVALAHNGNLPSVTQLLKFFKRHHIPVDEHNDSGLMQQALQYYMSQGKSIEYAVKKCFPLFTGAFSLILLTSDKVVAVRDSKGIRPLSLGQLADGSYVVASETCALDPIEATYLRDVNPGEMLVIDKVGLHSHMLAKGETKLDIFEMIYFARADSYLLGQSVDSVRKRLGMELAKECVPSDADIVIGVPDSGIPAAQGYATASGIPFDHGFVKNRYIHRTFIRPEQDLRERDVAIKLSAMTHVLKWKRVVVVDDSIVRGTTSRKMIQLLRKAGAEKIYMMVSSPPIIYPDFYGIDTPKQSDLIACKKSIEEIREYIGADSLCFLSFEGMIRATGLPQEVFSTASFDGNYPIDILERRNEVTFRK